MKNLKLLLYLGQLALLLIIYYAGWYCEKNYSWGGGMLFLVLLICCLLGAWIWETFQTLDTRIKSPAKWLTLLVVIMMGVASISIPLYYGKENLKGDNLGHKNCTDKEFSVIQDIYPQ